MSLRPVNAVSMTAGSRNPHGEWIQNDIVAAHGVKAESTETCWRMRPSACTMRSAPTITT
jgi:hypothetical protein